MSEHPILVYVSLVVAVLLVIAQAVPKILGPIGTGMTEWSRQRREKRIETREADMIDVQRQVEYLTEQRKIDRMEHAREKAEDAAEIEALKAEFAEHRRMWAGRESRWRGEWQVHRQWDYRAQEALLGREPPFDIAPPFMTPDPVSSTRRDHHGE